MDRTPLVLEDSRETKLVELVAKRRVEIEFRDAADTAVRTYNIQIKALLDEAGVTPGERIQLPDGALVQIVQPKDKLTVNATKLVMANVDPKVIEACTDVRPVAPYIKIDAPATPSHASTGDVVDVRATDATH